MTKEPVGENCIFGGVRADSGLDADQDGELSESEIDETEFICDGMNGADGSDGEDLSGCSVVGTAPLSGFGLLALMGLIRRRRS